MLSKLPRALTITVVLYVLPVLPKLSLFSDPRLLLIIAACFALDLTQPALSGKAERPATDRHSLQLVMVSAAICHISPVIEWVYFTPSHPLPVPQVLGWVMVIGGTVLRAWAIRVLGRFFSAHVELQAEHNLVRQGPYRVIRHPSYSGAALFLIGVPLLLQTPVSLVVCLVLLAVAYGYRIPIEEKMLRAHFGSQFDDYASSTKRMIPYIW